MMTHRPRTDRIGMAIGVAAVVLFLVAVLAVVLLNRADGTTSVADAAGAVRSETVRKPFGNRSETSNTNPTRTGNVDRATANPAEALWRAEIDHFDAITLARDELLAELARLVRQTGSRYLKAEYEAFKKDGTLPILPAAQPAVQRYLQQVQIADEKLARVKGGRK